MCNSEYTVVESACNDYFSFLFFKHLILFCFGVDSEPVEMCLMMDIKQPVTRYHTVVVDLESNDARYSGQVVDQ